MLLISMHLQNLVKIHLFILEAIERKWNSDINKGRNSVMSWQKWTLNNPKLDVININACAKFGQNSFIHIHDIQWKRNYDVIQGP